MPFRNISLVVLGRPDLGITFAKVSSSCDVFLNITLVVLDRPDLDITFTKVS